MKLTQEAFGSWGGGVKFPEALKDGQGEEDMIAVERKTAQSNQWEITSSTYCHLLRTEWLCSSE
jgi:hypothetical protein